MWSKYTNYSDALEKLNLQTLDERGQSLCVKIAKKYVITEKIIKNHSLKDIRTENTEADEMHL